MLENIAKFRKFIGPEVWVYFLLSPLVGLLLFGIEYSFIFVMQGFLCSLGILAKERAFIPTWYPTGLGYSIFILFIFGALRAIIFMIKNHYSTMLQLTFTFKQRVNILTFGLKNTHLLSTKEIVSIFTEIIAQSGAVITNSSLLINTAVSALFFFIAGLRIAPIEMLFGVGALALFILPLKFTNKRISNIGSGLVKEWENSSESLVRGLRNNFFLTVYNQVDNEIKSGTESLNKSKKHFINYSLLSGYLSALPLFVGLAILCLITLISTKYIHTEPMKLISFFYIYTRLAQAASEANGSLSRLQLSMPGIKMLYYWHDQFERSQNKIILDKVTIENKEVIIEAKDLTFGYSKKQILFNEINFKIINSDVLVIKGESGTGKSTLLSLLLGLFQPIKGDVQINSFSTHEYSFDLHKILAYVGPEPYIIQGTVKENLLYGLDNKIDISDNDLWLALDKMELKELIEKLPLKLSEPIHDIPQLSTGQKQRLSFARALVRKPSLLILDEATANLDLNTEKKIIDNLESLFKSCTSIIVTHKNSFDSIATCTLNLAHNSEGNI